MSVAVADFAIVVAVVAFVLPHFGSFSISSIILLGNPLVIRIAQYWKRRMNWYSFDILFERARPVLLVERLELSVQDWMKLSRWILSVIKNKVGQQVRQMDRVLGRHCLCASVSLSQQG